MGRRVRAHAALVLRLNQSDERKQLREMSPTLFVAEQGRVCERTEISAFPQRNLCARAQTELSEVDYSKVECQKWDSLCHAKAWFIRWGRAIIILK